MDKLCYRCLQYTMENGRCKSCHSPAVPPRDATQAHVLPLGTLLDEGNIIVGEKLGGGGFGITYIARDKTYGLVALKEFFPSSCVSRQGLNVIPYADRQKHFNSSKRDFLREVKHLIRLKEHPHIVHVLFEFEENNTCYYGMELLRGQSLLQYLQKNGKMTPVDAYVLLEPVMSALSYMHERDCLHRDIAPDNIYLRNDDSMPMKLSPCVIDFGAAFTDRDSFTYVAPNVGKPGFSPPDQKYEVDKQGPFTDVYALCATYYYMITGKVPLSSDNRILQQDAKLLPPSFYSPGISPKVDEIIMHGMELDTTKRIQTVAEMRNLLHAELFEPKKTVWTPKPPKPPKPQKTSQMPPPVDPAKRLATRERMLSLISCFVEWLAYFGMAALITKGQFPHWLLIGFALSLALNVSFMQLLDGSTFGQKLLGLAMESRRPGNPVWAQMCYNLFRSIVPVQLVAELVALAVPGQDPFTETISDLYTCIPSGTKVKDNTYLPPPRSGPTIPANPDPPPATSSTHQLNCISGNMQGQVVPLENGCIIGKAVNPPYRISDDMAVSRMHCSFHCKEGKWYIRDEGSKNGTYVGQKRMTPQQYFLIKPGDLIIIGHERFVFQQS